MEKFKTLFGIEKAEIKKTCILAPILTKGLLNGLNIQKIFKANLYASGNNDQVTLIHTLVGSSFVGDAVLQLADTNCQNFILFGSCGLVRKTSKLDLGTLVTPSESVAMESFSDLLSGKNNRFSSSHADKNFLNKFLHYLRQENIFSLRCASMGSLSLEKKFKTYFLKNNIEVLDMESSAFFLAAKHINKKALALFYVTDILQEKPLFTALSPDEKVSVRNASIKAIKLLRNFSNYLSKT